MAVACTLDGATDAANRAAPPAAALVAAPTPALAVPA